MNYRHVYHAGNFADVLKHVTLALVIEHLKLKPAPFRVVDTHAGVGNYDLFSVEAGKTGEWREGIARVLAADKPVDVAAILQPYLDALRPGEVDGHLRMYPGSPLLARRLIRPIDRIVANELHPEDAESLAALFARDKQVKVSRMDGWTALKALLPPIERRGVVLVDPPFEQHGELERLVTGLKEAVRRFATGVVMLWYPIKAAAPVAAFERQLIDTGIARLLRVELLLRPQHETTSLSGTGLVILNPPHTLQDKLLILLPFLTKVLGGETQAGCRVNWLTP